MVVKVVSIKSVQFVQDGQCCDFVGWQIVVCCVEEEGLVVFVVVIVEEGCCFGVGVCDDDVVDVYDVELEVC